MSTASPPPRRALRYEQRLWWLCLLVGLPGALLALGLLWSGDFAERTRWTLSLLLALGWLAAALTLRERVIRPLQTLSNLLAALREGDFSIRARGARADDALGLALLEINALSETLRQQRIGALEATALLRTVMEETDVAMVAVDEAGTVRLANRAAERLLARPAARLIGAAAAELGLEPCLSGPAPRTLEGSFPGGSGRWELRRSDFRQRGLPHQLLVLAELSRALREEERQAWQRLVRVLSHEINNSLTPIQSIAGSLRDTLARQPRPADWEEDVRQGLAVMQTRSAALGRFMGTYARLTRLPPPEREVVDVRAWVTRIAALERRMPVRIESPHEVALPGDGDQLDQLLINLVRNAVDAAAETGGAVTIGWHPCADALTLWVDDEGPGIASTANLFVPFFTTKPNGSGIGLALSRQIAEAHGGTLRLLERTDGPGCRAELRLPI